VNRVYNILPSNGELPCSFAERLGIQYSSQVSETHKKKQGQFFTPVEIARFMASLCNLKKPKIRILDPGCGTAILSCAMVEALISTNRNLSEIELVAYETDEKLILLAQQSLSYLKSWTEIQNIRLTFVLLVSDFVLSNSDILENQNQPREFFDLIISNPPYFKLQKSDYRAKAANHFYYTPQFCIGIIF
jgi:adenine-specific DNA-methyltransferase